jgi:hypothetical protein
MKMNSCKHLDRVIDYRLHRLTDEEEKEFEVHLESCAVCQHELAVERAIEEELSVKLDPGFIESKIMTRWRLRREQGIRSFWLYAYRVIVLGITAAVLAFILFPFLLRFPIASGLERLLGGLPQINPIFIGVGFGYALLIASSIFTLVRTRRQP